MNLIDRIGSDTIAKLEKAAPHRLAEAIDLHARGHDLAAVYLCGYAAEMVIGSAYFRIQGHPDNQAIPEDRRRLATRTAARLDYRVFSDPSHPLDGWARLLVEEKEALSPPGYPTEFVPQFLTRIDAIARHWWPKLRYRDFQATKSQAEEVIEATRWLITNATSL